MGESLLADQVELVDLCVGAKHWHVLARFLPLGAAVWSLLPENRKQKPRD